MKIVITYYKQTTYEYDLQDLPASVGSQSLDSGSPEAETWRCILTTERDRRRVQVFLSFAKLISTLSTCGRLQVGTIITDKNFEHVLGIGYNGNAAGEPNTCDSDTPGACGCVHSEVNALIKCGSTDKDKVMFVTTHPCLACSKLIVNSGFSKIFYSNDYRVEDGGRELLNRRGVHQSKMEAT